MWHRCPRCRLEDRGIVGVHSPFRCSIPDGSAAADGVLGLGIREPGHRATARHLRAASTARHSQPVGRVELDGLVRWVISITAGWAWLGHADNRLSKRGSMVQLPTYQKLAQERMADSRAMTMLREVGSLFARKSKNVDRCLHEILGVAIAIAGKLDVLHLECQKVRSTWTIPLTN